MEANEDKVLDLSSQKLKKIPRHLATEKNSSSIEVRLDNNEIAKLEFLNAFQSVEKFTASKNLLLRMNGVQSFKNLIYLDLSYNKLVCIEGLRELVHLTHLDLSHNKIKEIEHTIQKNVRLEYFDVSHNLVSHISNMSHLIRLKSLFIHDNQIQNLKHCELYLPKSLEKLTLAKNAIEDLNEICHLVELINLKELSFANNPCVESTGQVIAVEYRPFLVNWCLALKVIDGYAVSDIESLKGEWLYSQGKGRKFRPGEHNELVQYLSENVSFSGDQLDSEQDRKLRLVLSKAREHKSPLNPLLGPGKAASRVTPQIMSRSLDQAIFRSSEQHPGAGDCLSRSLHCATLPSEKEPTLDDVTGPLQADSTLLPVPESLVSPMVATVPDISQVSSSKEFQQPMMPKDPLMHYQSEMPSTSTLVKTNDEAFPQIPDKDKLQAIKTIAEEMKVKKISGVDRGAVSQTQIHTEARTSENLGSYTSYFPEASQHGSGSSESQPDEAEIIERRISSSSVTSITPCRLSSGSHSSGHSTKSSKSKEEIISESVKNIVEIIKSGSDSQDSLQSSHPVGKKAEEAIYSNTSSSSSSAISQRTTEYATARSDEASLDRIEQNQSLPDEIHDEILRKIEGVTNDVCQIINQMKSARNTPDTARGDGSNRGGSPDSGSGSPDSAASRIQEVWRGYRSRRQHTVHTVTDSSELNRVNERLIKLSQDVDNVRSGLQMEHRLHSLQMKALQSLYQKFTALQVVQSERPTEIRELAATVERLNAQVQHLQNCIQEIMLRLGPSNPPGCTVSTQTEISAVQYPPDDLSFLMNRPSSLPLTTHHVSQFAEHLVGDALRGSVPTEPEEDVEE